MGQDGSGQGGATADGAARLDTFPRLLAQHAAVRGDRPAMRHKDLGVWRSWTWGEVNEEVRALAMGLRALGLRRGERVAVVGANRPALYWSILAAQCLGAVPVPVYADAVTDEMARVLAHAEVSLAVAQDQEQVDKLLEAAERLPTLRALLFDEPRGLRDYDRERLHDLSEVQAEGRRLLAAPGGAAALDAEVGAGGPDDLSIILYTSGTTGQSKGVMLAHGRSIAAARDTVAFDKLTDRDSVLASLPLAWVGDHYFNTAQALVAGFTVACPESADTVANDLREIGPSFYFAPPRVFEALLTRLTIRMEDAAAPKRWMVARFLDVARRVGGRVLDGERVGLKDRALYALGEALVYGPLKNALGFSNVRVAYTAGEAIGPELFAFYRSIGLNLKQLYGQTEAFLTVTAHPDGAIRAGTVGPAAPNVSLRIDPDTREVLYRSPGQFVGYFKDEAKTAETMTPDGFVRTGDAGVVGADGDLRIIDRAKDVGRLRSGALFAPKYIENKLKFSTDIKEVVAFGDGQDAVTCLVNIDLSSVGNWAERRGIAYASYQELAAHPRVVDLVAGHVAAMNRSLAQEGEMAASQVLRFLVLPKELDADDGELTRTQKVRRGFIAERYAPLVAALYDGSTSASIAAEVTFEDGRKGVLRATVAVRDAEVVPAPAPAPLRAAA